MNTEKQKKETQIQAGDLKNKVLERIRSEGVCPRSRWSFLCINYFVWALWILTIVIGAIAVSEMIYLSMHSGFEFFDVTHGGLMPFVFESLPYVWFAAFVLMVLIAYYDMRQTRRGYRYPLWQIVGSSFMLTVIGGTVLNAAGVNREFDGMMNEMMPGYISAEEWQEHLWMHPEDGRITGSFVEKEAARGQVRFTDSVGREWRLAIYELDPGQRELLFSGQRVRLMGEAQLEGKHMGDAPQLFYTCGVMPWMPEGGHTLETLRASRTEAKALLELYSPMEIGSNDSSNTRSPLRCREIVKRVFHKNY